MLLTDLFATTVARHPERPAVDVPPGRGRAARRVVTFAELAGMVDAVAAQLAPAVTKECFVVVLLPRTTAWLYAAQLGVLRAGAAHVCLDPSFPDAHVAHVVRDAAAVAIVTDAEGASRCRDFGVPVHVLPLPTPGPLAPQRAAPWLGPASLAYAIYTSGTTGAPKGVLIEHAGVVNLITSGVTRFALGPGDRIAQGSSAAYDSSVEETWLALASGATVVVLDDETVRAGPDLVPWLQRERVTVFCPPPTLLRAMDVRSPRDELPDLRLCYVGGEALPDDLATVWGGALWLENGYGPTECTVTVVRGRVVPGESVTIGTPVPPHVAWILDERLQPVPDGTTGELCIAGPGLARGYLGQPELTAQRFPTVPGIGRVYRTGDAVVRGPDGRLHYHGRIDAQVKVRGYRIELEAIESVLARCDGVREVACCAQDEGHERVLAAHVVPARAGAACDFGALATAVRAALPEYMVPARFATAATLPRTIGGKIDRKALPRVAAAASPAVGAAWQPADAAERALRDGFAAVLRVAPEAIAADADFFALGGDSLRAALLVSRLRREVAGAALAVRDVYTSPTPRALAARLAAATAAPPPAAAAPAVVPPMPWLFTTVQVGFLAALLLVASAAAWWLGFVAVPWLAARFTLTELLLVGPWCAAAGYGLYAMVATWLAVAAKELLIGRYRAGRHAAWSGFHLRHWLVVRLVRLVPWSLFEGTEMHAVVLRALGARIGQRVHLHRGVDLWRGGWDLLELGDDATLAREAHVGVCELADGHLVLGPVQIGPGATLATRAGTGPGVRIGAGAVVGPLSYLPAGTVVPAGASWSGVPAVGVGTAPAPAPVDVGSSALPPWRYTLLLLAGRLLQAPLLALPFTAVVWCAALLLGVDGARLAAWLAADGPASQPAWTWFAVLFAVVALPVSLLVRALVLRWTPRVPAGTHARWSWTHLCLQVRMEVLESAGGWLAGTLFWPQWLRLAGMRIGRDVEISSILDVLPEHVTLGGGSFLADGIYLGVPVQHGGSVTVAPTSLGERSFIGNHVVIDAGQQLPAGLVLGVCTVGDAARMPPETGWFGLPAFALPRREVRTMDRALTHAPGPLRFATRVFWELLRLCAPALPVWLALWWFDVVGQATTTGEALWRAAAATCAGGAVLLGTVLATKWLLLGRVRPGQHGLWSCWASRWDFHYVLWERYGRALLQQLEGTLLLPWFLRAIGMRIGRRCLLGDGFAQVVDPDMLSLGDGATVHAMFQAHSFEDRVLKIDRVHIGAGASVGCGTVVLYGADIGASACVMPHSVVMKQELLLPGRAYAGAPTVEVRSPSPEPAPAPAPAPAAATGREFAFDVARGLAVLGMVWLHFMPEPAAAASGMAAALTWAVHAPEGVPAALFVLLAGIAWVRSGTRDGDRVRWRAGWVLRRAAGLAALGVPFWVWAWPNDVLTAMALLLPCVAALLACGRGVATVALVLLLGAVPVAAVAWGDVVAGDCLADGTHLANHGVGWCTMRWFLLDGAYPLLPWLAIALLGAVLALAAAGDASRWRRWVWLAVPAALAAVLGDAWASARADELGDVAAHLSVTWQPTSLPFVLRNAGFAVAIVAFLTWRSLRRGLPSWLAPIAAVGRASLTHYLGHVLLVYAPLRLVWPAEDWPVAVGLAAAGGYAAFAMVASSAWFLRARRGPLEALLGRFAGPAR